MINKIKLLDDIESNTGTILATVNLLVAMIIRNFEYLFPVSAIVSIAMMAMFSILKTYKSFLSTTRFEAVKSINKLFR
jgi:hypothetical protein